MNQNLRQLNIEEIKKREIDIISEIDKFCRNNNIRYSIIGGTLIGAVRHQGFIPWDDDIDIAMTRENYEKFNKLYKSNKYKILTYQSTPNYYYSYIKVVDKNTVIFEKNLKNFEDNGIFIDIFPIDKVQENLKEIKRINIIGKIRNIAVTNKETIKNKKILQKILYPILKNINVQKLCKYMDKIAQKNEKQNLMMCGTIVAGSSNEKNIVPIELFEDYVDLKFENLNLMAVKNYDKFLRIIFGEYMKLPPKEQQISNHSFDAYMREV